MGSGDPLLLKALGMVGPAMLGEMAWSMVTLRPRSLATDSQRLLPRLKPPPKIDGIENIPVREPFLLVSNHFQARGLWVGWVAIAITAAVASVRSPETIETHWMITAEWATEIAGRQVVNPLSSVLFKRAARTWEAIAIPAGTADVSGRARALRQALGYLRIPRREVECGPEPVAIFPEGLASVALREAKPGSGAFMQRVNSTGVPLLPVGIHEKRGVLVVRFGAPFSLPEPPDRRRLDEWARAEVMARVAQLLPEELWGAYAETVSRKS